jgi:PAS domain S-box-containing protein/putative nucleotidyltransferase with HDIG domain
MKGTARKPKTTVEQSLKHSEFQYRRLFEAAQDGILILNAETGTIEDVNPYLIKMLGYSREEFEKKKLWEVGAFRDIEANQEAFEALQKNEYIRYEDLPLKTKDGRLIEVEFVSNVYLVGKKRVIQCNIRNTTERKRAEHVLQESEARYRRLFEAAQDGILILDPQTGMIEDVNPYLIKMLGYSREEFEKKRLWEVGAFRDIRANQEAFQALQENEYIRYDDLPLKTKDGRLIQVEFVSNVYLVGNKKVIQCNIRDITARKRADDAVRLSEEKYRTLVEDVDDGFYELDIRGVFTFVNPALARIYGFESPKDLVGREFSDFLAPEMPASLGEAYRNSMSTGNAPKVIKGQILRPDGTRAFIEVKPTMIFQSDQIVGTRGVVHDITARKLAEERIQRQLAHLTALSSIDRAIAGNFDLKLSLSEILTHVTAELGVDAADILILNPNFQMLEFGAERGFRTQTVRKAQVRLGESYAGRVALERQLVQIPNLKAKPDDLFLSTYLADEEFVCYYGVPLIAKGQVKGVLEVFHRTALQPDAEWLDFLNTLGGQTALAIESSMLFESFQRSNSELTLAYDATIEGWSRALDLRDEETEGHTLRVTEITVKLARAFGLSEVELVQVRWGALLHDIGKMGVSDGILLKPGSLTEEEWVAMKKHPGFAYEMLSPIRYLRLALDIPYCHHEKWDGSGYPRGLKGDQIPLVARIFAVVDVWDALSSNRPYRPAWTAEKVREHIHASSGTHFDPQVVELFLQNLDYI